MTEILLIVLLMLSINIRDRLLIMMPAYSNMGGRTVHQPIPVALAVAKDSYGPILARYLSPGK